MHCPVCESTELITGRVMGQGSQGGWTHRFFPAGLRFFKLKRSVPLLGRFDFQACSQCGHVWNKLDAAALKELLASGRR